MCVALVKCVDFFFFFPFCVSTSLLSSLMVAIHSCFSQPEEQSQLIERSISLCRLNFRNSDSDHVRNGGQGSKVRERSYKFQRDCAQPTPKILISSVSEDRGTMPQSFRKAAARSWSSEDFLADSSHVEDISISRVEEPKESASEVLINSSSRSPQLSYTYSPTATLMLESGNNESLIADSAINSPDSWVESDFGVMPEKFHESQSDSSLCDSGTTLDVYHATPVEITTIDEGFLPSIENGVPNVESTAERFIDEGIYSLGSLEHVQEKFKEDSIKKQPVLERERKASFENPNQVMTLQNLRAHNEAGIAEEVHSKHRDTSLLQKGEIPREQELSCEIHDEEALTSSNVEDLLENEKTTQSQLICELRIPDHFEELIKNTSVEESPSVEPEVLKKVVDYTGDIQAHEGQINSQSESQNERNISEVVEVETECQKTDPPAQETKFMSHENEERVENTQDKTSKGVLSGCADPQESSVTFDSLTNTYPMNLGRDTTSVDPSTSINIPLISISSEPGEQDRELTCDPDRQDQTGDDEDHQTKATGSKRSDSDRNCPPSPDELSCDTSDKNDKRHVESPFGLVSENVKQATSEQRRDIESVHLDDTNEHEISESSNANVCLQETIHKKERSKDKEECESLQHSQTGNTERDLIDQTSFTDTSSQPVKTKQGLKLTDQMDGHEDKLVDSAPPQQNTLNPGDLKHNEKTGISHCEAGGVCREMDLFYTDFDRNSSTDDLVCDPVEPMDLFYPDKEEPMFTEPPDTEIQSWPSVLSVSALQPAPTTEITLPDNQPCKMMVEDLRNGDDSIQDDSKVSMSLYHSASVMPFHFKMVFSF